MPEGNGTGRLDRIEAVLDKVGDRLDKLATSHYLHDERLSRIEADIEGLLRVQKQADQRVGDLVGAIRDLIGRIPAENLRGK